MVKRYLFLLLPLLWFSGCTVTYKLNGASVDYSRIKTISVLDFPNQATLIYAPLSQSFTEGLKEKFITQTKLKMLPREGDLQLEGEIVGYDLTPLAQRSDGYASETKLTLIVNVRYTNTTDEKENFEQRFSAYRTFTSASMLEDVQDDLLAEMTKEIAEAIFNKTVANW
jgi:hypothetical protein